MSQYEIRCCRIYKTLFESLGQRIFAMASVTLPVAHTFHILKTEYHSTSVASTGVHILQCCGVHCHAQMQQTLGAIAGELTGSGMT
jgi:hypothetical protein